MMISLIYKSRALPLAFTVVKGKKGHLPEDTHVELVKKLFPLIPESTQQMIFVSPLASTTSFYQKTFGEIMENAESKNLLQGLLKETEYIAKF